MRRIGVLAISCHVALVALSSLLCASCSRPAGQDGEAAGVSIVESQPPTTKHDPTVLVVSHSHSGRTAAAAEEIARVFRGRLHVFAGAPHERFDPDAVVSELDLDGVELLFLGFPIWFLEPSAPLVEVVHNLDLGGITVVPFYTYWHEVIPGSLDSLAEHLVERGAVVREPMALLIPVPASRSDIAIAARRTLLERTDLRWNREQPSQPDCRPLEAGGSLWCRVPSGNALVEMPTVAGGMADALAPEALSASEFWMQRGEVTIAEYEGCVSEGACPPRRLEGACAYPEMTGLDVPVACVDSGASQAYCRWSGGRLPTQTEWTRAFRGDSTDPYPWGDSFPFSGQLGNFGEASGAGLHLYEMPMPAGAISDGYAGLAPPCSFPSGNSRWGVCDLAGNAAEWVAPSSPALDRWALLAGASWLDNDPDALTPAAVTVFPAPGLSFYLSGFRCVRDAL